MNHRLVRLMFVLAVSSFTTTMVGCELFDHGLRHRDRDPEIKRTNLDRDPSEAETESEKMLDVQSDKEKPKPFFRGSRLPSALSDEASEIEGHLGIH